MILSGTVTLGRDSELRYSQSGTAICRINGAYNIGYGQNKETQWVSIALFGKQAESLSQYLTKGTRIEVAAKDVKVNTYQKKDGTTGVSLEAVAMDIGLLGGGQNSGQSEGRQQPQQAQNNIQQANNFQQPQTPQQAYVNSVQNDFDDNFPF
jgi:single-strand DNA-binding protein